MDPEEVIVEAPKENVAPPRPGKWGRRLIVYGTVAAILTSLGLSIFNVIMIHKLNSKIDGLFFNQTSSDYTHDHDLLTPDIGVIQFMRRGYSITFDSLVYTANGLEVKGTVGNPTQLNLSSINLKLSARPFLYLVKDKLDKDPFLIYSNDFEIGSGQATIYYLGSGKTALFSMTIPNVKQTKDGFQIDAMFSGERYSYF